MDPSYNNPFGSFGANSGQPTSSQPGAPMQPVQPAPILSPVGGDIVLPSQQKKKKTWLIIGIILIIVAIVAGIVAGVMLLTPKKSNGASVEQKFNMYANYLLYGEETDTKVEEFDPNDTFYVDENFENSEYTNRLKELFGVFYDSTSNTEKYNSVAFSLSEERIDFLQRYSNYSFIDYDTMRSTYLNLGKDETNKIITQMYSLNDEDSVENTNEIMYRYKQLDAKVLDLRFEIESSNGQDVSVLSAEYDEAQNEKELIVYSAIGLIKTQCLEAVDLNRKEAPDAV